MVKEFIVIKKLVAMFKDKATTENEKSVSQLQIVKKCKRLIDKSGLDSKKVDNMFLSGIMRQMFEDKKIVLHHNREQANIAKLIHVLDYNDIKYKKTIQSWEFKLELLN